MKNKTIDKLLSPAIEVIKTNLSDKNGKVPSEYKGYISSLGASIIQSGLRPAIALYLNTESSSKASKILLMLSIQQLIHPEQSPKKEEGEKKIANQLFKQILDACDQNEARYQQQMMEAATAIKLTLRTFEMTTNA